MEEISYQQIQRKYENLRLPKESESRRIFSFIARELHLDYIYRSTVSSNFNH